MNTFCPFINGECRKDCVFRLERQRSQDESRITVCQLATSTAVSEALCDKFLFGDDDDDNE